MQVARITHPSTPITDQAFVYRRSEHTDVAQTFARARERQQAAAPPATANQPARRAPAASRTTHALLPLQLPIL